MLEMKGTSATSVRPDGAERIKNRSLSVVEGSAIDESFFIINGCFGYAQQPYSRSLSKVEGLP
ncbi:hypothetical protein Calab_0861 [Caldithrix abyssi DSM 13497]|uniref:Uncharacterized protein n=1 Tax=Caldithrix abyssi DSM 13497 TaxID=880073 RepID=H1XUJ9_CALAY|nr:hypothetical protein Calab_0861 [Caldithrix abyssi DSM 13497]